MLIGYTCSELYGYWRAFGGYAGGPAKYVRIAWGLAAGLIVRYFRENGG